MSDIICSGCPESDDIERPDGFNYAIIACPRCKGKGHETRDYPDGPDYNDCPLCGASDVCEQRAALEASRDEYPAVRLPDAPTGRVPLPLHPALVGFAWLEDYYADSAWSNTSSFVGYHVEGNDDQTPTTLAPLRSLDEAQAALLVAGHALLLDGSRK